MFEKDSKSYKMLVVDMLREIGDFLREFGCDIDKMVPPEPRCNIITGELYITNPIFSFYTNKEKGISEEDEFMCKLLMRKGTSQFFTSLASGLVIDDEWIDNNMYYRNIMVDPVNLTFLYKYKDIIGDSYPGLPDEVRKTFKDTMIGMRDSENIQSKDIEFVSMVESLSIRNLSKEIQKFFHSVGMDADELVKPRIFIDKITGVMTMEPLQITFEVPSDDESLSPDFEKVTKTLSDAGNETNMGFESNTKMTITATRDLLKCIYKYNCLNK